MHGSYECTHGYREQPPENESGSFMVYSCLGLTRMTSSHTNISQAKVLPELRTQNRECLRPGQSPGSCWTSCLSQVPVSVKLCLSNRSLGFLQRFFVSKCPVLAQCFCLNSENKTSNRNVEWRNAQVVQRGVVCFQCRLRVKV